MSNDRRKALIREYKRTPKEMGVYCIRNTSNGRCFVSSSADIRARFNRHRMELKTGKENEKALLAEWQTFGEDVFEFTVLDTLEPLDGPGYDPRDDLQTLEAMWLEKLNPFQPEGYNRVPRARP